MSFPSSADPEPRALAIHLDLVGGLAGDMFVAAMLDAMPRLAAPLFAELAKVQPRGAAVPALTETEQAGLRAARFGLAARPRRPSIGTPASSGRSHASLRDEIGAAPLEEATKREALALLGHLAEAEAAVHGIPVDEVHFHELADWDSLLDVVAAGFIAARLDGAHWTASPVPLGGGTVKTAHGVLPVPAPATARLLIGYPCRDDGVGGERVTPTGAAILRHLVLPQHCGTPRAAGRLVGIGMGAGTKTIGGLPNVTRALVFERDAGVGPADVTTLEFDVDDMTGEEIALAAERLRETAGVIDVTVGTRTGKKGRPVCDFRVLAEPAAADAVAEACFVQTSTLGLRALSVRRKMLGREHATAGEGTRVKLARRPDGTTTAKAEHDDVREAATLDERRRARVEAEQRVLGDRR